MAEENPDLNVKFIHTQIEKFLPTIQAGEFDLVLGLSVLHNISKSIGLETVQNLMAELCKKIPCGVFEYALESVHKDYIPQDYRDFTPGYTFAKVLSYSTSRDSTNIPRPIVFASNKYCYFDELGLLKIDKVSYNVHSYLAKTDCMHFYCGDKFVKFFYAKTQDSFIKAQQEIQFLKELGGQNNLPKLYAAYAERDEFGIRFFIVRDKIEGITLKEKIASGENFNRWDIVKQALEWMVFLESHNYYDGDIGTNNFIYGDDGKLYLIDYEEMWHQPIVLCWPYRVNMLFLFFMNEVLNPDSRKFAFRRPRLLTELKKHVTQKQYEEILSIKDSEKYFARLYEILFKQDNNENNLKAEYNFSDLEILSLEKYLEDVAQRLQEYQNYFEQINNLFHVVSLQQKKIEELEKLVGEARRE